MRGILLAWLALVFCVCCATQSAQSPTTTRVVYTQTSQVQNIKRVYPSVARVDTTLGFLDDDDKTSGLVYQSYTGTAWTIATDGEWSILATAGHVCHEANDPNPDESDVKKHPTVFISSQSVHLPDGKDYDAEIVFDDDSSKQTDRCLLRVHYESTPLTLADSEPVAGDPIFYVGYPASNHAIESGYYVDVTEDNFQNLSVPATGGASGSAVIGPDGRVFGMLTRVHISYPNVAYATRLENLQLLYRKALIALSSGKS